MSEPIEKLREEAANLADMQDAKLNAQHFDPNTQTIYGDIYARGAERILEEALFALLKALAEEKNNV